MCWPDDPNYLGDRVEIELPPDRYTQVFWSTDILDTNNNKHDNVLRTNEPFLIRFRVELRGRLWKCVHGTWSFNVGFKPIGPGPGFYLSALLQEERNLRIENWKGCDTLCIEHIVTVPPGTIQVEGDQQVYEVAAHVDLRCCNGQVAVAGYEELPEYEIIMGNLGCPYPHLQGY
jgi:hypothetical protein